jgi:hypothetical protein
MLRRVLLIALSCALLLLPCLWILSTFPLGTHKQAQQEENLIPMLSSDVRQSLLTYQRQCLTDADCESPLGCFIKNSSQFHLCLDSTCETDRQCDEGFSCVPLKTASGKATVRICSLVGERKEGERCRVLPAVPEDGCARGLFCQGRCGRPCRLDEPSSCPAGFFCSEGREGPPSCLPSCEGRPCPEGLTCLPRGKRTSICAQVLGPDCRKNPCPTGQVCRVLEPPQRPWEIRTECRSLCGKDSSCPEGTFCHLYECHKPCDPRAPEDCGPGLTCGRHHPLDPWYCIPG